MNDERKCVRAAGSKTRNDSLPLAFLANMTKNGNNENAKEIEFSTIRSNVGVKWKQLERF